MLTINNIVPLIWLEHYFVNNNMIGCVAYFVNRCKNVISMVLYLYKNVCFNVQYCNYNVDLITYALLAYCYNVCNATFTLIAILCILWVGDICNTVAPPSDQLATCSFDFTHLVWRIVNARTQTRVFIHGSAHTKSCNYRRLYGRLCTPSNSDNSMMMSFFTTQLCFVWSKVIAACAVMGRQ